METTKKKYNKPDIEDFISNMGMESTEDPETILVETVEHGRLWKEFLECLKEDDDTIERCDTKKYSIDDDILETMRQCDFGKPVVDVINSILRAFLVDNLGHLRDIYRPRVTSLFDKYPQNTEI